MDADYQEFNIVAFSDQAEKWRSSVVPVTSDNIAEALYWVYDLEPEGGTYMMQAFKYACSVPDVNGIYFLSDGNWRKGTINTIRRAERSRAANLGLYHPVVS